MADYDYSQINNALSTGDYEVVYQTLEEDASILYTKHDEVLYGLDKGLVSHYSGEFSRSNTELSEAEKKIYEYFTKSISQSISSFLLNDTVVDYAGETYEDIYTNFFMALNYIHMNDMEGAFVEIRRFDNKLKTISAQYADLITQANLSNKENGAETVSDYDIEFHNSALARYLSLIMYRSTGKLDSAEVDKKYIDSAFKMQPSLYNFPIPSAVSEEFCIPENLGRLNVFAFSGLSPIKVEEVMRIASNDGSFYYKIALPEMQRQNSVVYSGEVFVYNLQGELVANANLEKMESIENIAIDMFEQKKDLLYLKATARSISKSVATSVWGSLADSETDVATASFFSLMQVVSAVSTEVSERADVRSSKFFPATAWVAGINVPAGEYNVTVVYKNSSGNIVKEEVFPVIVDLAELNLLESICLR